MSEPPLLLTVREAAAILGTGRDATYGLVRSGRIRSIPVGRKRLIPRSELERFIEREIGGETNSPGVEAGAVR
jgi:excisionase family DNA binding protein